MTKCERLIKKNMVTLTEYSGKSIKLVNIDKLYRYLR